MSADFWDDVPTGEVPRDPTRGGMPLIRPEHDPAGFTIPYTRASSLGDFLEDNEHLARWEKRLLAQGLGRRPDLAAMAASEVYTTGLNRPTVQPGKSLNSASGRRLDDIVNRALDHAGVHERADYGSAVHQWTEPGAVRPVPDIHTAIDDVAAWDRDIARYGIKILGTEVFVVCDELQVAGTFDHLLWVPGYGVVIDDKKTGKVKDFSIQLATYSRSKVYDPATGLRTPLDEFASGVLGREVDVRDDVGLVSMIVAGAVTWVEVDLDRGWERARLAAAVRDDRTETVMPVDVTSKIATAARAEQPSADDSLLAGIAAAGSHDELAELWLNNRDTWRAAHTAAATERKKALT